MDKNTVIGFILIAAIIIGFAWINKPSQEEIERRQRYNDSVQLVMQQEYEKQLQLDSMKTAVAENLENVEEGDSAFVAMKMDAFGGFGVSSMGEEQLYTLENDLIEINLSSKGGKVKSVNLKAYKAQEDAPLILFDDDENNFNLVFVTNNNRVVNTSELFFEQQGELVVDAEGNSKISLRINTDIEDSYIDFVYTLPKDDYMLKFDIVSHKMNEIIPLSLNSLDLQWNALVRQQEKGRRFEDQLSTLSYKYLADNVEKLNATKKDSKEINNQIKWIAFKDQYFSSVLIADESFATARLSSSKKDENSGYIKEYAAELVVPYDPMGNKPTGFTYYFGPNHFKTLSAYDKGKSGVEDLRLRELVPLGWGILGWVNRYFVIPMFNLFSNFTTSFGIIILLMTIVIKLVLFPLSYKSYMSSAKMRVLKPEIDEINARIPAEKAMERQQATMALYNKVGVSPMSGCLPMLLQMPILIALFRFFPGAIELRQESFLWVKDLSSYDAILTWQGNIPLISNIFDNHISLFAVLMTITSIFSTRISMASTQPSPDQPGAGMMKSMGYVMPVMFFFLFNSYASGLTYYYTLSSLFTVIQNEIIKASIDEKKLLEQLHAKAKEKANNKKGAKKGGFMARLEQMQREQQKMIRDNAKNKKR